MLLKKMHVMFLSLLLIALLAGCGSGGGNTGGNQAANTPGTSQNGASGNEGSSSTEGATITVLNEGAVAIGVGVLSELLEKSKEKTIADETLNPRITEEDYNYTPGQPLKKAGVFPYYYQSIINEKMKSKNITVKTEDWGWGEPLIQKQTAGFLAKNMPDIIVGETQMPGFAQQGLLEPFPDDMAQEIREKVAPAAWKPMEYDGKIYGFASQPGVSSLFWNKKLVQEAGLDPDKAPATWDELLANVKKVTEAGKGKFYGGGVYAGPNAGGYLRYGTLLVINGGGFADDQGQPVFNSDANVETVQFLKELNANHPAGLMVNTTEGTYFDAFKKGQIAYLIDGPWRAIESSQIGIDYGMSQIPLSPNGKAGNITIGAAFHAVPKDAKNKEAAFEYIRAMYSEEIQQLIADTGVRSPVLKSVAETDAYKEAHPEMYQHYLAMTGNVQGLPTFKNSDSKVWQIFGEAVTKALMTKEDIKSILDDAQKKAEAYTK
ncbi:ABC transporter, solute-binding protein [Paenibacillus sp. oral taxon 786 str. D14]|uniref:extracellular solute-binding protein n=1 Tax=Paenibacillus sp. oral taxon 786 TaxID=652715 RepID=UPI0001AFCE22|nr:extracellular solute-binding protein [Paenibacillus sp. oral taxon 786]EES73224.1 ABC transporter, solute-binding protein [Paenibacillus sp. oral taxon 786 str. D14]